MIGRDSGCECGTHRVRYANVSEAHRGHVCASWTSSQFRQSRAVGSCTVVPQARRRMGRGSIDVSRLTRAASATGCVRQKTARSLASSCDEPFPHHALQSRHHHSSTTYLSSTVWRSVSSGPWQARHNAAAAVDACGVHETSVRMPKDNATHGPTVRPRISE